MSDFHIVVFFNDYYTLIIAFLTKQIQNRYRYRRLPDSASKTSVVINWAQSGFSLYHILNKSKIPE